MSALPIDHPQRMLLADEVHARPPEPVATPTRATYVAVLVQAEDRPVEHEHVSGLCERFGADPPLEGTTHFAASRKGAILR